MRYTKPMKSSQVAVFQACDLYVCSKEVCVHDDCEWTIKFHAFVCVFVRGCRMIHLAVLLPAAVSSNLIRSGESPSPSPARNELFTSLPTAYLIAWMNDKKQMNLSSPLHVRWSGCRPFAPPYITTTLHTLSVLYYLPFTQMTQCILYYTQGK